VPGNPDGTGSSRVVHNRNWNWIRASSERAATPNIFGIVSTATGTSQNGLRVILLRVREQNKTEAAEEAHEIISS